MIKESLLFSSILLGACTTTELPQRDQIAPGQYVDLTQGADKGYLDKYWVIKKKGRIATYERIIRVSGRGSGCVQFIAAIESNGKASQYVLKKTIPAGMFDSKAAAKLQSIQWSPVESNVDLQPVLVNINMNFFGSNDSKRKESAKKCGCRDPWA